MVPPLAAHLSVTMTGRTVYDGAGIGDSSFDVVARQRADGTAHNGWVTVFWYGHNNINDPARIKSDIAASVNALAPGNSRFVIVSLINEDTPRGIRGGPEHAIVVQLNNELAALYPANFLDVRGPLIQRYNPSDARDVVDFNNDVPPTSVRYDEIHLRDGGSSFVAGLVRNFIVGKGW